MAGVFISFLQECRGTQRLVKDPGLAPSFNNYVLPRRKDIKVPLEPLTPASLFTATYSTAFQSLISQN
jgi:hypothetical protein